jgi:hypothetical protein
MMLLTEAPSCSPDCPIGVQFQHVPGKAGIGQPALASRLPSLNWKLLRDKSSDLPWWICIAVCHSLKRWQDSESLHPQGAR